MQSALTLRQIAQTDWLWLKAWFRDPWLDRELGPMGRDWLLHVLEDRGGVQLVAQKDDAPAALFGVTWATTRYPSHVVTDLAVAPRLRRTGIGRAALAATLAWSGHPPTQSWRAFVAEGNKAPAHLLAATGWTEIRLEKGMRCFQWAALDRVGQTGSGNASSA